MRVRAVWYDAGCPPLKRFEKMNIIPADEQGAVVGIAPIKHWMAEDAWAQWKDVQDAALSLRIESELMTRRMKLVKEQLDQSSSVRRRAYKEIEEKGFDTSASAVQAFFKAAEAERGLMQIERVIEDLTRKETPDLQKEFRELAERAGATMIDGEEIEDSAEPLDT